MVQLPCGTQDEVGTEGKMKTNAVDALKFEGLDENTKSEILEMDSVLREFFGFEVAWGYMGNKSPLWSQYGMGIVEGDELVWNGWWYGDTLKECFEMMVGSINRGKVLERHGKRVVLPVFESVSELRMKLELLGMDKMGQK